MKERGREKGRVRKKREGEKGRVGRGKEKGEMG